MGSPSAVCFFSGELPEVVVVWRILPSARSRSNTGQREDSAGWGVVSVLARRGEWLLGFFGKAQSGTRTNPRVAVV